MVSDFDTFWAAYPRKQGKIAAERKYAVARRRASAADILAGVERYKQHLPDDPQYICMPQTFLNQGRWMDEYDVPVKKKRVELDPDWFDECKRLHDLSCGERLFHYHRMLREHDARKSEAS